MTYKHYQQPDHNSMTVNGHCGITVTDIVSKWTNIGNSKYYNRKRYFRRLINKN